MNANSSLKHLVDILNSGIDNKNKKIKQLMDQKTTMNQEMLNREKAIAQGGHSKKFRQGCSCHFFGFEISQFIIFLGLLKMRVIFWGLEK